MNRLYILLYILIILSCNEDKNDNIFIDENEDVDINYGCAVIEDMCTCFCCKVLDCFIKYVLSINHIRYHSV